MPMTPREKSLQGLALLKEAILETLREHPQGLRNSEIADRLELRSDFQGKQKDYLSWSVLGLLVNDSLVIQRDDKKFILAEPDDS